MFLRLQKVENVINCCKRPVDLVKQQRFVMGRTLTVVVRVVSNLASNV